AFDHVRGEQVMDSLRGDRRILGHVTLGRRGRSAFPAGAHAVARSRTPAGTVRHTTPTTVARGLGRCIHPIDTPPSFPNLAAGARIHPSEARPGRAARTGRSCRAEPVVPARPGGGLLLQTGGRTDVPRQ